MGLQFSMTRHDVPALKEFDIAAMRERSLVSFFAAAQRGIPKRVRLPRREIVAVWTLVLSLLSAVTLSAPSEAAETSFRPAGVFDEDCAGWTTSEPLPSWAEQMPKPQPTGVSRMDAEVTVASGDRVFARVFLPDAYAQPLPTVLQLWHASTVAGADTNPLCEVEPAGVFLLRRGYAFVLADIIGTGNSTGCWDLGGPAEQQAGKAVVDWIAARTWSDGTVGMRGESGGGLSQVATAATRPNALKAISPGSPTPPYEAFHTGATTINQVGLTAFLFGLQAAPATNATSPGYAETLAEVACPGDYVKWNDADGTLDAYWRQRHLALLAARGTTPALTSVGYPFADPVHIGWDAMWRALEASGAPRKGFVGPWEHEPPTLPNWPLYQLRWFEHWLRGNDSGIMAEPALTLVDQNGNIRTGDSFPVDTVSFHASAGRLGGQPQRRTTTYTDIPGAPQSVLRASGGSLDYISEPFAVPVRFSGVGHLRLSATVDTTDTDFAVLVYDRGPDGAVRAITWGYLDARHRTALDQPGADVIPGAATDYRVRLAGTEWTLPAGHRLQLYLASSDGCTTASGVTGSDPYSPPCSEMGALRSDGSRATVAVHEGPGLTRLDFPAVPVSQ